MTAAHKDDPAFIGGVAQVRIERMRKADIPDVVAIENKVFPGPWSETLFKNEISLRTKRRYVVAKIDGEIVGYCGLMYAVDETHITTLAVEPGWQHHKIGTQLMIDAMHATLSQGIDAMTLEVRLLDRPTQELYQRFGFVPNGVRKNYYQETKEDALIMWAEDLASAEYRDRLHQIEIDTFGASASYEWKG